MGVFSSERGLLFLIGGAEDRNRDKIILKSMVDRTKAQQVAIVPTASSYPQDICRTYEDAFQDLGIRHTHCLDIRYPDEAEREEHLRTVERADLIFFGGGDQVKLVDTLLHTKLHSCIHDRFAAGNLHIAGTSAGAAAAGNPMLFHGNHDGLVKGSVEHSEGFGFVDGVTVDTHFSERGRIDRLSQFLLAGNCKKGIGLDEDTAIMVCPNDQFTVIGSGRVTVLNSAKVTGSNYNRIADGDPLRFNNMRFGSLAPGSMFSMRKWSIMSHTGVTNKCLEPSVQ